MGQNVLVLCNQRKWLPVQYSLLFHVEAYTLDDMEHTRHQASQILLVLWGHDILNIYSYIVQAEGINWRHTLSRIYLYILTRCRSYSCSHMCHLCCSFCRRHTGQAPGPSNLSLSTAGHTHGLLQLHTQQHKISFIYSLSAAETLFASEEFIYSTIIIIHNIDNTNVTTLF